MALLIVTVLIDSTFANFLRAWQRGDSSMDIRLPVWPSKLMVPVALSVLWLRLVIQTCDYARLVVYPDATPIAVPVLGDGRGAGEGGNRRGPRARRQDRRMIDLEPLHLGVVGCGLLVLLCVLGVRIAFAAAIVGTLGLVSMLGWSRGISAIGTIPHATTANYTLSVLPMFILIGYLAYYARITEAAFEAARRWFGWMPGGLAIGTVYAVAGFSAVSGANTAAAAVFSKVAIPEMLKAGYDRRLAAGVVAAGATLDSLIPPSALLVVYGIIVEESIGKLLIAGFAPGIFSALVYTAIIAIMCTRNPSLGRPIRGFTWGQRFASLPGTFPIVLVIAIIFYSMLYGWATPTEAGALGAFCVFVIALFHGMKQKELKQALLESAKLTAMIFTVIWGVLIFTRFLGFVGLPKALAEWVVELNMPPIGDPARHLCPVSGARHDHRRHRHVPPDPAGDLPGGAGARFRSDLVRHHPGEAQRHCDPVAAGRPGRVRRQRRAAGYSSRRYLPRHRSVHRRRHHHDRGSDCFPGDRDLHRQERQLRRT